MKKSKNIILLTLCLAVIICVTGCKNNNSENIDNYTNDNAEYNFTKIDYSKPVYTIAEIKEEFNTDSYKYEFKPFYNVNNNTNFTFHFNSEVDPILAVTVHTDSKCEVNSTVLQFNEGYITENGVDVIVYPPEKSSVLESEDRLDYTEETYTWGNAPIYYLCIRYDLDSTTVKKLENPIIIPFTVKQKISTPYAYASIDSNGNFVIKWDKVDNAVSYNIYKASYANNKYTASEMAYSGVYPKKKKTVDASVLEYSGDIYNYKDSSSSNNSAFNSLWIDYNGYISNQNYGVSGSFYITAVDSEGNESFFSNEISTKNYITVVPKKVANNAHGIADGKYYIEEFLDEIEVSSVSTGIFGGEEASFMYPINYKKIGTPNSYSHTCEYEYEILGTMLNGKISYYNVNDNFPDTHISIKSLNRVEMPQQPKGDIRPSDVELFIDEDYSNSVIDLSEKIEYPADNKVMYSAAFLYMRTDMFLSRIFGGILDDSLDDDEIRNPLDIKSYVIPDDYSSETEEIRDNSGNITGYVIKEKGNMEYLAIRYFDSNKKFTGFEVNKNPNYVQKNETEFEKREISNEPAKVINSTNFVEEQRKSTQRQVTAADKDEVQGTKYPVIAETAGQKYLALKLINQEENISLKAFPSYQNTEELYDDLLYVWYQNPYIMGIDVSNCKYDYKNQVIKIKYNVDSETSKKQQEEVYKKVNEIVKEIIKNDMTDTEKSVAIYNYLANNSSYNKEAYNYALSGADDFYTLYANSWNAYGILCEKTGVCQSYAYAYNALANISGLKTIMVVGTLNNGGHAWNATYIDGKWYMLDVTNNGKSMDGVEYWVCNASTEFIEKNGFVLDDAFVIGDDTSEFLNSDSKNDWYTLNNKSPKNIEECAEIWNKYKDSEDVILMKYDLGNAEMQKKFWGNFKSEVKKQGVTDSEISNWKVYSFSGILMFKKLINN